MLVVRSVFVKQYNFNLTQQHRNINTFKQKSVHMNHNVLIQVCSPCKINANTILYTIMLYAITESLFQIKKSQSYEKKIIKILLIQTTDPDFQLDPELTQDPDAVELIQKADTAVLFLL